MAVPIIGERCHYCSRTVPLFELIKFGDSMVRCARCEENHIAALDVLAGNPPKACGECGVTFELLAARTLGAEVKMAVHMKDGMYQLLCSVCDEKYVRQRPDLYGPTEFGWKRKLR